MPQVDQNNPEEEPATASDAAAWAIRFRERTGRAPRILHVGNIANNAYINAKLLNEAGLDCDVICYGYYHIMGCPEWEDADFSRNYGDQFKPDWEAAGVKNFIRPRWFAQGPMEYCIEYLIAKREGRLREAERFWLKLGILNQSYSNTNPTDKKKIYRRWTWFQHKAARIKRGLAYVSTANGVASRIAGSCDAGLIATKTKSEIARLFVTWCLISAALIIRMACLPFRHFLIAQRNQIYSFDNKVAELIDKYAELFPSRPDPLTPIDLESYRLKVPQWHRLFEFYDLVQAYATDPVLPLLSGHPYIAFEHGTIRNIPYEDSTQGRLCALSYRLSDWTVVTNADNMNSARRIGIQNYTFVPHPVNEDGIRDANFDTSLRKELLSKLNATYLVFHPARQHWSEKRHPDWEKGNDIFLRGFARFVHEVEKRAAVVLVEWGASVEDSRALIERLGITDHVIWVPPMPHRRMVEYIRACDLVADQFFLGAFGSTLPKALACGRVSMLYLDPEIHRECFHEMPPVLSAKTSDEVFLQLSFAHGNKKEIEEIQEQGKQWYQRYHSNKAIADKLMSIYSCILDKSPELSD